ncbi:uncharacterized protein BDR25DRAFT_354451 [Lindgomyces ingoldianus]|uniref:Uncharacterized protein n=1 Tax=Lindgomyces ingoldianus TaxID=673940 RepID=A0ACB6QY35_9PLEO|nr:uncharacterized protein BDR25DRAFT_354451 [Lindgomyces ingoldianus]KAF2471192.1 hypothetical protein BDR25DRAFT_354451 [Lindgomyces ingoldianus]
MCFVEQMDPKASNETDVLGRDMLIPIGFNVEKERQLADHLDTKISSREATKFPNLAGITIAIKVPGNFRTIHYIKQHYERIRYRGNVGQSTSMFPAPTMLIFDRPKERCLTIGFMLASSRFLTPDKLLDMVMISYILGTKSLATVHSSSLPLGDLKRSHPLLRCDPKSHFRDYPQKAQGLLTVCGFPAFMRCSSIGHLFDFRRYQWKKAPQGFAQSPMGSSPEFPFTSPIVLAFVTLKSEDNKHSSFYTRFCCCPQRDERSVMGYLLILLLL